MSADPNFMVMTEGTPTMGRKIAEIVEKRAGGKGEGTSRDPSEDDPQIRSGDDR